MVTLSEVLQRRAEHDGDRVMFDFAGSSYTYRDVQARAETWHLILSDAGAQPGARIMFLSANRPEFVFALYGALQLGAAVVLCSPAWKAGEIAHACAVVSPDLAVADAAGRATLTDAAPELPTLAFEDPPVLSGHVGFWQVEDPDADAVLVFSSGTTGFPKAVRHTHRSMGHGVQHWITALGLTDADRFQIATPPVHILGLLNIFTAVAAGARFRLHARFDLDASLRTVQDERLTLEMAVAPIALGMANHAHLEEFDLSSLRYVMWCATPVTPSVAEAVTDRVGINWMTAYGTSELPVLTCNSLDGAKLDTVGRAVPGVDLRIVSLEDGTPVGTGEVGEIQARSGSVMAGYLPDEATAQAFSDGWYRTGDVGYLDTDGWLRITDRAKEMIKVRGFQVAPAEIEAVLHGHPLVDDCAVFGVDDEADGEAVVAAVETHGVVDPDDLIALVADRLASYKQLSRVVVVPEIPRLPSGKVLRRVLKEHHGRPSDG
jgi:acyl-CoA synthetase (AMP-forming)/AMP-acid ligase II